MLFFGGEGEIGKAFHVRDGLGIRLLLDAGVKVAVISGRSGPATASRLRELGLADDMVILGSKDKVRDLERLQHVAGGLGRTEVAAMGDDLPDIPLLSAAGFSACPADAAPDVAAACDLVCGARGGMGAVREIAELILKAQGRWSGLIRRWTGSERIGED